MMMKHETLNVKGKVCPAPVILVKRKLEEMKRGQILEVLLDYPQARDNIVRMTEKLGHKVLSSQMENGRIILYIKRGNAG